MSEPLFNNMVGSSQQQFTGQLIALRTKAEAKAKGVLTDVFAIEVPLLHAHKALKYVHTTIFLLCRLIDLPQGP